jgi:hypothetical protein
VKTDKSGSYFYAGLPVGTYDLSLNVDGAVVASVTGIKTRVGEPAVVNFDLRQGALENKLSTDVSLSSVVELFKSARTTTAPALLMFGGVLRSRITVVNLDVVAGDFQLAFLEGSGASQAVMLEKLGRTDAVRGTVVPGGSVSFRTTAGGDVQGVSVLFASQQKMALYVRIEYVESNTTFLELTSRPGPVMRRAAVPFSNVSPIESVVVLVNPDSRYEAPVSITARSEGGKVLGEAQVTIGPLGVQLIRTVSVSTDTTGQEGTIELRLGDGAQGAGFGASVAEIASTGFLSVLDPVDWQ